MQQKKIDYILSNVKAPLDHPLFYPRVFALAARSRRIEKRSPIADVIEEEYDELSRRLERSEIQEGCAVRNVMRSRRLAMLLIDDKGELQQPLLAEAIEALKNHLYSLGPSRQYDAKRQEHLLKALEKLQGNKDLTRLLKKVTKPLSNKYIEQLIRDTLQLPAHTLITDAHTKRAVLSAWLSLLRQNVGSCFATAPAEVVQDEQPEQFLQDLIDLLATSRLKRTFAGIEYSVPLSASWGGGDLKKPLLLQKSSKGFDPEIWYSPGLMAAFEAAGLLKLEDTVKNKAAQIQGWITPLLVQHALHQPYILVTAEELIRFTLLQSYNLTEQNIQDYENRPRGLIQSQLLIQPHPKGRNGGGLGERCANFLYQFDVAKSAFKALADNALLKSWEFTLASFSETKLEFTRWNLYASLGMGTQEPGGIGQCIYQIVQRKIEDINRRIEDMRGEYEMVYAQVKTLESRIRHASSEKEAQWIKMEYQNRTSEFYSMEEQYNQLQFQAKSLVTLYDALYSLYLDFFKDYFQEVYDADMQEVTTGPFDDSPAGFRLLYKHGRSNTSQWTRIRNQHDFIDALSSFFVATEPQVLTALDRKDLERDLSEIVTAIINHVKTKEFLETALYRMAAAHQVPIIKNPLEHLDQVEKKPWVYTSGGTMNTLVSCYYRLEDKPKEVEKWVESPLELLVFLADTLKHISPKLLEPYLNGKRVAMLMQSPTHAFLLKPALPTFKEAWMNEDFTYTAVRDRVFKPAEQFVENLMLDDSMMQFLLDKMFVKVPENFQPRFKSVFKNVSGPMTSLYFREYIVETLEHDRGLQIGRRPVLATEEIDSLLYTHLPLFPVHELKDRLQKILILLPGIDEAKMEDILSLFNQIPLSRDVLLLGARQLQDICKALLCIWHADTAIPFDFHLHVSQAAQKLGFAMPTPVIFADTNWVKDEFGFVVNPGTGRFELWRIDYTGSVGYPMSSWKEWLDGSRTHPKWTIYVKPYEYGQI